MILEMFLHPSWTPPVVNSTGHDFKRHTPVCARSHRWSYQHEVRRASNKNPVGHLWRDLKSFLMYLAAFTFFCVCVCLLLHYCRELTIMWVISVTWMEVWSCLGRYLKAAVSVLVEWLIHSRSHLSDDSQDRSLATLWITSKMSTQVENIGSPSVKLYGWEATWRFLKNPKYVLFPF